MKVHTTNYKDTFIEIAEDSPNYSGEIPPMKGEEKSIATIQFEMLNQNPYKFTSDEILFHCYAAKNGFTSNERDAKRELFFSKGQPCFRCSPLTKRYGWGIHSNEEGKIAMYGSETDGYKKFSADKSLQIVKAMRSKKA